MCAFTKFCHKLSKTSDKFAIGSRFSNIYYAQPDTTMGFFDLFFGNSSSDQAPTQDGDRSVFDTDRFRNRGSGNWVDWEDVATGEVETDGFNPQHPEVLRAFAAHIMNGEPLVAPGVEGIRGLTLANAMYLSSWTNSSVTAVPVPAVRLSCS